MIKYIITIVALFASSCSSNVVAPVTDSNQTEVSSVKICCEKCERNPERWKPICERARFIAEMEIGLASLEELNRELAEMNERK